MVEPEIDRLRALHAADEQAGRDQEHERQRDLCDDQRAAHPVPRAAGQAAAAFPQHLVQIRARRAERRQQPDDEARCQRDQRDIAEDAPVEGQIEADWQIYGDRDARDQPAEHETQAGARKTSEPGEEEAFGQQLADETPASRAERGAQGQLALADGGADHQEVDDVDAGDEQHESDQQHEHAGDVWIAVRGVGFGPRLPLVQQPRADRLLVSGYCVSSCALTTSTAACACCSVTPGARCPITWIVIVAARHHFLSGLG